MKYILALALLLFAAPVHAAEPPPAAVFDSEPFTNGTFFSSIPCAESFACNEYYTPEQYIQGADMCSTSLLGYPQGIMAYFETQGPYENCALPSTFVPKNEKLSGNAQWPICCFEEIATSPGMCRFTCFSYISG